MNPLSEKLKLLGNLYITFLKLGSVSFGGGYAMLSLMEHEVVEQKHWVDKEKIIDIFAVSESLPGAIALNSSAFVGYSICGIPGALAALLGNLTSPVIIVLSLMLLFTQIQSYPVIQEAFRGIYPAIVGLIAYAAYKIGKTSIKDLICFIIMIAAFCASTFFNAQPILLIVIGAFLGILITKIKSCINNAKRTSSEGISKGGNKL